MFIISAWYPSLPWSICLFVCFFWILEKIVLAWLSLFRRGCPWYSKNEKRIIKQVKRAEDFRKRKPDASCGTEERSLTAPSRSFFFPTFPARSLRPRDTKRPVRRRGPSLYNWIRWSVILSSSQRPQRVVYNEQGWCSPRSMRCLIVFLVILMILR